MQSVLRSLMTLEAISTSQPVRLSELARIVNLPKTTVARIVRTLSAAGWIAGDANIGDPRWRLTARALAVGSTVSSGVDLREVARGIITELGAQTDENIHLSAPDGDSMVLIERVPSSRSVQTVASVGDRVPMYLTASGWAYLALLPQEDVLEHLPRELEATTSISVVDPSELISELEAVALRGFAINPGRWRADVASIGAAITDRVGRPIGSLSISMPSYRFSEDIVEPFGQLVRAATEAVSQEYARRSIGSSQSANEARRPAPEPASAPEILE